jgi:hypothetical protein
MDRFLRRQQYGMTASVVATPAGQPLAWCSTYANESNVPNPLKGSLVVGLTDQVPRPVVGRAGYLVV